MGVVYAAHDERLDRPVAIKMILDSGGDAVARERFWREARAAASISHPNVCQLYEIGEADGQLYIVMELLDGESLTPRPHWRQICDLNQRCLPSPGAGSWSCWWDRSRRLGWPPKGRSRLDGGRNWRNGWPDHPVVSRNSNGPT